MGRGWSEIAASFPPSALAAQGAMLAAVKAGDYVQPTFVEVTTTDPARGNVARFAVAADAFQLGRPGDSVRINPSHATAQQIVDWLGWSMMTPRVDDATAQAAKGSGLFLGANAFTSGALWGIKGAPTTVQKMVEHSLAIDHAVELKQGQGKLLAGPWKQWVSMRRLLYPDAKWPDGAPVLALGKNSGLQYGFYDDNAPSRSVTSASLKLWQPPGTTHPISYTDYSEKLRPMLRWAVVQRGADPGELMDVYNIAADPELAPLISVEGTLNMHHPWLPVCEPLSEGGGCVGGGGGFKPKPGPKPKPGKPGTKPELLAYDWGRLAPLGALALIGAAAWRAA
jgi:hypothetical protein